MSENPVTMSYEDESPVRMPVLTPGKTGDLAPEPPAREWIGSVMANQLDMIDPVELLVFVRGSQVEMDRFRFSLEEAITLACTLMDACHFIVRKPHRARVEAELVALRRECEEAPV